MQLVAIQMVSGPDITKNFQQVESQLQLFEQQRSEETVLVVLPECFALYGGSATLNTEQMEVLGEGEISKKMAALARKYNIWLAAGTVPTCCEVANKFQATLPVYNPQGELVGDYQKLHLFDVDVSDNTQSYRESDATAPGQKVVTVDVAGVTVGLAVCYDVRFPALFSQMAVQGAEIIVLPSAFTRPTGKAHWHNLLQTRAIENQVFMVAAGQGGVHANGRESYGHSLIVDPWGTVVTEVKEEGPGWVHWRFDQQQLAAIRRKMPVLKHNRFVNQLVVADNDK